MSEQLAEYVRKAREQGMADGEIKKNLLAASWQESLINEALGAPTAPVAPGSVPPPPGLVARKTASNIFKEAWSVYKAKFGTLLLIVAIPALLLYGALLLGPLLEEAGGEKVSAGTSLALSIAFLIIIIVSIVLQYISQIALVLAIKGRAEGFGARESYARAFRIAFSYFWVSFLTGLIVLGGFVLLIIPGIIFSLQFAFAAFVLIGEGDRGIQALLKSREYVKGRLGDLFARLFALSIVVGVVVYLPIILLDLLKVSEIVLNFVSGGIGLLATPFAVVYMYLTYENFRDTHGQITNLPPGRGKIVGWAVWGMIAIPLIIIGLFVIIGLGLGRKQNNAQDTFRDKQIVDIVKDVDLRDNLEIEKIKLVSETTNDVVKDSAIDPGLRSFRRILVIPDNEPDKVLAKADSYFFTSSQEQRVYEPIVNRTDQTFVRLDTNAPYQAFQERFPIDFDKVKIGPDKARRIAEAYPEFVKFQQDHPGNHYKWVELEHWSVGHVWRSVVTTDIGTEPKGQTIAIIIDSVTGKVISTE